MADERINKLAQKIAAKLINILDKENEVEAINQKIQALNDEIEELEGSKRLLEQEIQSEKFIITDRLHNKQESKSISSEKLTVVESDYAEGY